ncbi:MAG: 4Fe-4S binding protein [Promethearchaeota archaeon]
MHEVKSLQGNVPVLLIWIVIIGVVLILLKKKKLSTKVASLLLVISFIIGGVIFAATPNPVMPIQQVILALNGSVEFAQLIPMIVILAVLLISVFIFGRAICGYACPLGALQELLSKIKFKSKYKKSEQVKTIKVSNRVARLIRLSFTIIFFIGGILWGLAFFKNVNVFLGFSIFKGFNISLILVPVIFLVIIGILSIFIYRPWCRFLCPFGMFANEIGNYSVLGLHRNDNCIDCGVCEKVCPTKVAGRGAKKGECYLCGRCVEACPKNAISYKHYGGSNKSANNE